MTDRAKKAWEHIQDNLDTPNRIVIIGIRRITGCTQDTASEAIIHWAAGNKQWFEDTFNGPMMGISYITMTKEITITIEDYAMSNDSWSPRNCPLKQAIDRQLPELEADKVGVSIVCKVIDGLTRVIGHLSPGFHYGDFTLMGKAHAEDNTDHVFKTTFTSCYPHMYGEMPGEY